MESTIASPTTETPTPTDDIRHRTKGPRTLRSLRHETRQRLLDTKENIREHPRQAALIAFGTGTLLSFLPLAAIVTSILRVGLLLAKPALLILGGMKAIEEYRKNQGQNQGQSQRHPENA